MSKARCDRYETQLKTEELEEWRGRLLAPDANLKEIRQRLPAWRSGRYAGRAPSMHTVYMVAERLRDGAGLGLSWRGLGQVKGALRRMKRLMPQWSRPEEQLEDVLRLVTNEVAQRTLRGEDTPERDSLLKLLLKLQEMAGKRS